MTHPWDRAFVALAGLAGALGVGLSALAAHLTGGGSLDTAARFLLVHAPALLGLAALMGAGLIRRGLGLAAGLVLVAGLVLFCGDLALRALSGIAPLRLAAPTGGVLLMVGWVLVAAAGLVGRR